jgi:2-desacetyl-2-hydroxyethyl bacteriochlorophyllide A dehydrogenase
LRARNEIMSAQAESTRAAVWHGGSRLELESWDLPELGADDVLVEISACGLCGSDLHVLDDGFPGLEPPVVLGHEPSGTVAAVGSRVDGFAAGDVVTWEPNVVCGECFQCREGEDVNLCEHKLRVSGSFADRTVVPRRALHHLPPGCSREEAIMAEPLSCALYAFERAGLRLGQSVAIIGSGTIGLLLLLLARRAGAGSILVSDPNARKRAVARQLGADEVVDPVREDLGEAGIGLTGGRGFDCAFEAVGRPRAVEDALRLCRPGGHAVLVGASQPDETAALDLVSLQRRDLTVSACWVRRYSFQRAVALLPSLPLAGLLTHEVPLHSVGEAIRLLREGEAIKVAVIP